MEINENRIAGIQRYRRLRRAVKTLRAVPSEEHLWEAVVAFQNYPFRTAKGLPFRYTIKQGRKGLTKELLVDRRERSKSLSWSSVMLAFYKIKDEKRLVERPKALGDIRGVSYIYPLFYCFGLIKVPPKTAKNCANYYRTINFLKEK